MTTELLHQGARLYARWLALQLALNHYEQIEIGLTEGNLPARLGVHVMETHNMYRSSIPENLVEETTYFKDALNELVARGEKVF
jgi:hypothetical protein